MSATALDVFTVLVLFPVTRTLGGFDLRSALVVTGLTACAFALADLLVGNIERIKLYVRTGLLRRRAGAPARRAAAAAAAWTCRPRKISRGLFGLGVLRRRAGPGRRRTGRRPGSRWRSSPRSAASVFFGAVFVGTASVAFWWTESGEFGNAFTYGGRDFTSYPMNIYSGWFRDVFAYGLGFAFVAYYPALALLGRADPLGLPGWVGWVAPAVAVPAVAVAGLVWRVGVRHYRSTGS